VNNVKVSGNATQVGTGLDCIYNNFVSDRTSFFETLIRTPGGNSSTWHASILARIVMKRPQALTNAELN
jgi:hypothetical protein